MKTSHFIYSLIAISLFASCGQTTSQEKLADTENQIPITSNKMFANNSSGFQNNEPFKVVMKYFKDSTGAKSYRMPLPSNWKVNPNYKDSLKIKGPNGIEVLEINQMGFYYTEDLEKQKQLKNLGLELLPYVTIEQLAPSFLKTLGEKGLTEVKNYPLPAYRERSQKEANRLELGGASATIFAKVFELKGPDNEDALVLIGQSKITIENVDFWSVNISVLRTPKADFEKAKDIYLFALNHIELNPKTIDDANREFKAEMQRNAGN